MLYELIIDHDYARKFDFQYNLIYNALADVKDNYILNINEVQKVAEEE